MATGTVVVATGPTKERAVLLHWAASAGYWAIPIAAERSLPQSLPTREAVLVFDESWVHEPSMASSIASRRGIASIAVFGPERSFTVEAILAAKCTDFLLRPYEPDEVFARIRRAMDEQSRREPESDLVLRRMGIDIESVSRAISCGGRTVRLRPAEYNVLMRLVDAFPRQVSQTELVEDVLGTHGSGATARNQVYELRRKLATIGASALIETMHGSHSYRIRNAS